MAKTEAITISHPHKNTPNGWATPVHGHFWGEKVQVMVHAADNRWYPQPRVATHGHHYDGVAYLGWQEHPNAKEYTIAAGVGGDYVTDVVDELPADILWTQVTVERI